MSDPNPIKNEDLFRTVLLGDVETPGEVVSITGHDRKVDWDVKAASGQVGASTTLKGLPLREVTVTIYLADQDDFNAWPACRTALLSTISGPKPKAIDIYHPDISANDIASVVLSSIGGVVHDKKGGQTIIIKLQEYKPPKPKGGSPSGSKGSSKGPDPNAEKLAQLAALTDTFNRTPWDGEKARRPDERFR